MKQVLYVILLSTSLFSQAVAQDASIFPKGEKSANAHNTGTVWLNELSAPDSNFSFNTAFATFAQNAKLDWHFHPGGQILLITEGVLPGKRKANTNCSQRGCDQMPSRC